MVMNVLGTRLGETGKDWRYVYKALAVIEYLISHGSERAVDDIIEQTFQISLLLPLFVCISQSLTSFEYVELRGKDMGINVRKKAETIVGLLNNKEKIQEARDKAAANRNKYIGLSSTGITYKSGASSYSSGGFHGGGDSYGGLSSTRENTYVKSRRGNASEKQGNSSKESRHHDSQDPKNKFSSNSNEYSQSTSNSYDDGDDDFDPRGTSNSKPVAGSSNQVDLFGKSLIDDLFDGPASVPTEKPTMNTEAEVDLFADATFASAPTKEAIEASPQAQGLTADMTANTVTSLQASPTVDLFASNDPVVQPDTTAPKPDPVNANIVDPFAAVPLNNFDGSDISGSFTSHSDSASKEPTQNPINEANRNNVSTKSSQDSKAPQKKDTFQVKSGIWADSLSRGIIDLNISAPKKVSLADERDEM
ncbi:hypothetical protein DITRI_Ditri10aG0112700 [Diplodiscus trichospermus]